MHSKQIKMKRKTETILTVSKFLALLGGVWYSILWGSQLMTLIASFINPDWAKRTYEVDLNLFSIREHSIGFYAYAMCLTIAVSVLKAIIWFVVFDLLSKLKLQTPFFDGSGKKIRKNCLPVAWCLDRKQHFLEDIYLLPLESYGHTVTS